MSFTFNDAIPAANNNPSFDQPEMLQNNISNALIWEEDHVGFNDGSGHGGTHTQLRFFQFASPTPPAGTVDSVAYPAAGVADASHAQFYFKNSLATFLVNSVKAWGSFVVTPSSTTLIDKYNCSLSTNANGQISTITISSGVTASTSYTVIPFITGNTTVTYSITGTSTFTLTNGIAGIGQKISFIVLQA